MTCVAKLSRGLGVACALALLTAAGRADDLPKFRSKGDAEKKFVSEVAVAIVKAAHFSIQGAGPGEVQARGGQEGPHQAGVRASYKGKVSGKEYFADIVVHVDTLDKDKWEVLRIEYSDNNNVPYGAKRSMH